MAIIKHYEKLLEKSENVIHKLKYITVSPCGLNHDPMFELWESKPWIAKGYSFGWHWDWVGPGNITFHNNTVKDLNKLGRILFGKEINMGGERNPDKCIIQLYE